MCLVVAKSCFLSWLREDVCTYTLDGPGSIPVESVVAFNVFYMTWCCCDLKAGKIVTNQLASSHLPELQWIPFKTQSKSYNAYTCS